jgi:hypothetical protein
MKFIGQYIQSFIARFRSDVYLEDIDAGTIASGGNLGLDSNNKIVKATITSGGGDLTAIVAGTGLSGTSLTGPIPTLNVDASQTGITAVGTLTALTVDGINIDGDTITADDDLNIVATGNDITVDTDNFTIESATSVKPTFTLKATVNSNKPANFGFVKDRGAAGISGDFIGDTYYVSDNDAQEQITMAIVSGKVADATDGAEEGEYIISVKNTAHATVPREAFKLTGYGAVTNVALGYGATSRAVINGVLVMGSTDAINNSGVIQVAAQPVIDHDQLANYAANQHFTQANITTVGTIGAGVWNGTKITDIYTNSSGKRYGSTIKILPSDFMINDDAASPLSFKDGSNSGVHVNDAANEVVAFVTIPEGMMATHVDVYGTHNKTLKVWAPRVDQSFDFTSTTLGTGACNTQLDIADTNATEENYLAIQVTLTATSQRIWGGIVTIAPQ